MAQLGDLRPRPQYWVVGQTHPKVRAQQGEVYRDRLIERAEQGGSGLVHFDDRYLTTPELHRAGPAGRHRAAALRLPRAGDLRRADRGGHRGQTGHLHRVPARRRAVDGRGGPDRRAPGSDQHRRRTPPGAHRAGAGRRACAPRPSGSPPTCCGRRSPTAIAGPLARRCAPTSRWPARESAGHPSPPSSAVSFDHLFRLSDGGGLFEHARLDRAPARARLLHRRHRPRPGRHRPGAGSRTARAERAGRLLPLAGHRRPEPRTAGSTTGAASDLSWTDEPSLEDCWGRALWGLGTAAARLPLGSASAELALTHFDRSVEQRSPDLRAMTFAALGRRRGADPSSRSSPGPRPAGRRRRPGQRRSARPAPWPWPEPRLRYANAALPEILLAAGVAARRPRDRSTAAWPCSAGCSTSRPPVTTCRSPRSAAG